MVVCVTVVMTDHEMEQFSQECWKDTLVNNILNREDYNFIPPW